MKRFLIGPLFLLGPLVAAGRASQGLEDLVRAEVRFLEARASGNRVVLDDLYSSASLPPEVRGRALLALYAGVRAPIPSAEQAQLSSALSDPAPEVRRAALRVIGEAGERLLERKALDSAAEDPDPAVRVEALRAVHRWTRQGHLYYLEQALRSEWPQVQAEAVRNLGVMAPPELPAEILAAVQTLASPPADPRVRGRALEALKRWNRLEWAVAREALADPMVPEQLRLDALSLSESFVRAEERQEILLDILRRDPSPRLAWAAYRRLASSREAEGALSKALASYLVQVGRKDAATDQMAELLREKGYRVEHVAGKWQVSGR